MELRNHLFSRISVKIALASVTAFLLLLPDPAFSKASFYEGKTIRLVVGFPPGGRADMANRALVPFLSKYIPGQPQIVLEFMAGGGGRKAANYTYGRARPDGLTIGWAGATLFVNAVLDVPGVEYDIDKLIYVGSNDYLDHPVFFTRKEAGLNSLEKLRIASGVRIGSLSIGSHLYTTGRLFAYLLDLKEPRFVTGYSSQEQDLAVEQGELDYRVQASQMILRRKPAWLKKMDFHAIWVVRGDRDPPFAHLPELNSFARSKQERKLMELWRILKSTGQPYFGPPGTPKDRVEILQKGFRKALDDPQFITQFEKLNGFDYIPLLLEDVHKMVKEIPREPEVVELLKKLAGPAPLPAR